MYQSTRIGEHAREMADSRAAHGRLSARAGSVRVSAIAPVGVAALVAVGFGFSIRDDHHLVPAEGLGYALGVLGLAMMLLLLLYSLRKRWSPLRRAGPIQRWFQIHMALGILGPVAILFHANFRLGSMNSNVALACMLTVSLSGVIGRFLYTRVHDEHLGRIASLDALREAAAGQGQVIAAATLAAPNVGSILAQFRDDSLCASLGARGRAGAFATLGRRARVARGRALRAYGELDAAKDPLLPTRRQVRRAVAEHVRAIRAAAEFEVYARLFSLWHALHLPFCVVLFLAAAIHVVAAHMY